MQRFQGGVQQNLMKVWTTIKVLLKTVSNYCQMEKQRRLLAHGDTVENTVLWDTGTNARAGKGFPGFWRNGRLTQT